MAVKEATVHLLISAHSPVTSLLIMENALEIKPFGGKNGRKMKQVCALVKGSTCLGSFFFGCSLGSLAADHLEMAFVLQSEFPNIIGTDVLEI